MLYTTANIVPINDKKIYMCNNSVLQRAGVRLVEWLSITCAKTGTMVVKSIHYYETGICGRRWGCSAMGMSARSGFWGPDNLDAVFLQ